MGVHLLFWRRVHTYILSVEYTLLLYSNPVRVMQALTCAFFFYAPQVWYAMIAFASLGVLWLLLLLLLPPCHAMLAQRTRELSNDVSNALTKYSPQVPWG